MDLRPIVHIAWRGDRVEQGGVTLIVCSRKELEERLRKRVVGTTHNKYVSD